METRPSSGELSPANSTTTPVASGELMLKKGPATGFWLPSTCVSLSHQPAYQTSRSMEALTSASAAFAVLPCALTSVAVSDSRRLSIISAAR